MRGLWATRKKAQKTLNRRTRGLTGSAPQTYTTSSRRCKAGSRRSSQNARFSDFAPTGQRATEGDLVRVLEVAAHRKSARESRDPHAVRAPGAQPVGDVRRGCLTGHV